MPSIGIEVLMLILARPAGSFVRIEPLSILFSERRAETTVTVTQVRIFPVKNTDSKLKAFALITLNDCFRVRGLRVIQGENGLFVGMPRRKTKSGKFVDVAHPLSADLNQKICDAVLDAYNAVASQE